MALAFDEEFLKWSYRYETRTDQKPSAKKLRDWDETLRKRYEKHLEKHMPDHGIPRTKRNRSIIALLALMSAGDTEQKVKNACAYWANARDVVVDPVV